MDISGIISALKKGADYAEKLLPIASQFGGPIVGIVAKSVATVIDVAANVKDRIDDGTVVFTSNDQAEIAAITARLAKVNDALAKQIADS